MADSDADANSFGTALRAIRMNQNLSMRDVYSKATGRTYYSALENGTKNPTLAKVDEIAAALEVSPLALLLLTYAQESNGSMLSLMAHAKADLTKLGLWDES